MPRLSKKAPEAYEPDDFDTQAIALVQNEKRDYETGSQEIRTMIKKARQNYACMFDNPFTTSGRRKTFIPMTRWEVDTVVPKVFVNDKAITVLPENESATRSSFIADKVLKHQMKETRFPTYLRNSLYDLEIDGTTVFALFWNFEKENITIDAKTGKTKKTKPMTKVNVLSDTIAFKQVDVLNCFIDPTADSIQDAPSFIFRNVLSKDQVDRNTQYSNKNFVKGYTTETFDTWDARSTRQWDVGNNTQQFEQPMVGVYERWGRFPKSFITKDVKDSATMIDGVITVADLDNGVPILLRAAKSPFKHGKKPFEECWNQKKQGRWYGIGIGEKLIPLQRYMNKSVNRREENEDVLHTGLFKVRRGSGISTKSITSVPGGVIEVDNMADFEQIKTQDISQLSNGTIMMINSFVERINGANEIATGDAADRSATTSIIKDRNSDTRFAAIRGYVNDFLLRFFKQWIQLDRQFLDKNFVIRVTGEDTELNEIDDALGTPMEVRAKMPNYRFIDVSPEDIRGDYGLEVDIDQSIPMNKAENADRILKAMELESKLQMGRDLNPMFDAYLDAIGLQGAKFKSKRQLPMAGPVGAGQPGQMPPVPSELAQFLQGQGGMASAGQGGAAQAPGLQTNEIPNLARG